MRRATVMAVLSTTLGCGSGGDDGGTRGDAQCADGTPATGCAVALEPGADATGRVQTAFIEARSGDTICFCPGTYAIERELSLTVPGATVRGLGASRSDVVLDFASQSEGDDGVTATASDVTFERFSVKNTPGNGVVVTGGDGVTFRDLHVSWDAGSDSANGAYALYPVESTRVIVEESEVVGATDAAVYLGQCTNAILRNNVARGSVIGIEVENSEDVEVYGNVASDNTVGIALFTLPHLPRKRNVRLLVRDNELVDNNRPNFAPMGALAASVDPGNGIYMLASQDVEIRDNRIEGNGSTGITMFSAELAETYDQNITPDPEAMRVSARVHIHSNAFRDNGRAPSAVAQFLSGGLTMLENVLWDGVEDAPGSAKICLGESDLPTFRNYDFRKEGVDPTDTTNHRCALPPVQPAGP